MSAATESGMERLFAALVYRRFLLSLQLGVGCGLAAKIHGKKEARGRRLCFVGVSRFSITYATLGVVRRLAEHTHVPRTQ
jgi:hypothetical protein